MTMTPTTGFGISSDLVDQIEVLIGIIASIFVIIFGSRGIIDFVKWMQKRRGRTKRKKFLIPPKRRPLPSVKESKLAQLRWALFADRGDLVRLFEQILAVTDLPFDVLAIFGIGGVGKSYALEKLRQMCVKASIPVARVDGQQSHTITEILMRLYYEMRQFELIHFDSFHKELEFYFATHNKLLEQNVIRQELLDILAKDSLISNITALRRDVSKSVSEQDVELAVIGIHG